MFEKLLKHLENRRKWNRTRAWMNEQATGRAIIGLVRSGAVKVPVRRRPRMLRLWGAK